MANLTTLIVTDREQLSPDMLRIHFRSEDLSAFAESQDTDRYVKLVFLHPDVAYPEPFDMEAIRRDLPPAAQPILRTYTVRSFDLKAGTLAIDFVVHGDVGVAGPWAAKAQPGETIRIYGPGGAYAPDSAADWHLIAGDETALPAIAAALEALPEQAQGYAFIEVRGPEDELPLTAPAGVRLQWIYRGHAAHSAPDSVAGLDSPLLAAVKAAPWQEGRAQVFVHGEAQAVMHGIRPYIVKERGVPRADVSISGYWRRGRTEEAFREWKREFAQKEGS